MMLWRRSRVVGPPGTPPPNLLGLFARKESKFLKVQTPFASLWAVILNSMRSKAAPNLIECLPRAQEASSYPWNEFQSYILAGSPPTPPDIEVRPATFTTDALRPSNAPREVSPAAGLSALTPTSLFTNSWLNPKRTAFTKLAPKL